MALFRVEAQRSRRLRERRALPHPVATWSKGSKGFSRKTRNHIGRRYAGRKPTELMVQRGYSHAA